MQNFKEKSKHPSCPSNTCRRHLFGCSECFLLPLCLRKLSLNDPICPQTSSSFTASLSSCHPLRFFSSSTSNPFLVFLLSPDLHHSEHVGSSRRHSSAGWMASMIPPPLWLFCPKLACFSNRTKLRNSVSIPPPRTELMAFIRGHLILTTSSNCT